MKSDAIALIKQKGNCYAPENIRCLHCCIEKICQKSIQQKGRKTSLTREEKYEAVLKAFIKEFGQDALVEALM